MAKSKSRLKTCVNFKDDLNTLLLTGQTNDNYIKHLGKCNQCQSVMQTRILKNLKAQVSK